MVETVGTKTDSLVPWRHPHSGKYAGKSPIFFIPPFPLASNTDTFDFWWSFGANFVIIFPLLLDNFPHLCYTYPRQKCRWVLYRLLTVWGKSASSEVLFLFFKKPAKRSHDRPAGICFLLFGISTVRSRDLAIISFFTVKSLCDCHEGFLHNFIFSNTIEQT